MIVAVFLGIGVVASIAGQCSGSKQPESTIVPGGTIDYYDAVTRKLGGGYRHTQKFARLFMAPGVGHCGGGDGPQPQGLFEARVNWVELAKAPDQLLAAKTNAGRVTQTRPLCPYPALARWTGTGSTDDAANFVCRASFGKHLFDPDDSEEAGERE
jgi:hypothetical protein